MAQNNLFRCSKCPALFLTEFDLENHSNSCGKSNKPKLSELDTPIRDSVLTNFDENMFTCFCGFQNRQAARLTDHRKQKLPECEVRKCIVCTQLFKSVNFYVSHSCKPKRIKKSTPNINTLSKERNDSPESPQYDSFSKEETAELKELMKTNAKNVSINRPK